MLLQRPVRWRITGQEAVDAGFQIGVDLGDGVAVLRGRGQFGKRSRDGVSTSAANVKQVRA